MSVDDYLLELQYRGLSSNTINSRRFVLKAFESHLTKPTKRITRKEVLAWITKQGLAPSTQRQYRKWLNAFFRFAKIDIILPPLKVKKELLRRQDMVTAEDVQQMLLAADHPRDRALIHVLYETGARASEVLGIRLQDIEFGQQLTRIRLDGKTGPRVVPVIECVPNLQLWLNYCHPLEPNEIIWQGRYGAISYMRLGQIMQRVSHQALGRVVTAHKLRHSRTTELLKNPHFTDALVRKRMGWTKGSAVIGRYDHLVDEDLDEATLAMYGITQISEEEEPTPSPLLPKSCPRCNHVNPAEAKYCSQCSLILDPQEATQYMEDEETIEGFLRYLFEKKPDLIRQLAQEMRDSKEKE